MSLGTMDLGFGSNGVGIHGVPVMLIFNPGSDLDGNTIVVITFLLLRPELCI